MHSSEAGAGIWPQLDTTADKIHVQINKTRPSISRIISLVWCGVPGPKLRRPVKNCLRFRPPATAADGLPPGRVFPVIWPMMVAAVAAPTFLETFNAFTASSWGRDASLLIQGPPRRRREMHLQLEKWKGPSRVCV